MGGSDPNNATLDVLQVLAAILRNDSQILAILGPSNPHGPSLQAAVKKCPRAQLLQNPPNLPELMAACDMAITAGGGTVWELAYFGVPSIVLVIAENQRPCAEELKARQACLVVDGLAGEPTDALAAAIGRFLESPDERATCAARFSAMVDGLGAVRVCATMKALFVITCIMQPTYLPWSGYFNLVAQANDFVFLDDVQFSHQSWQQRNRIVANGQPLVLSVPVLTSDRGPQLISAVRVDESKNWRKKHVRTLQQAYAKHPFGKQAVDQVEGIIGGGSDLLMDINIALILAFCRALELTATFHRSSALAIAGARSERLLEICRLLHADTYLSPRGSQEYLEEDGVFAGSEVALRYQEFVPRPYPQRGVGEFISHMSIVDLVANAGFQGAREYVAPLAT